MNLSMLLMQNEPVSSPNQNSSLPSDQNSSKVGDEFNVDDENVDIENDDSMDVIITEDTASSGKSVPTTTAASSEASHQPTTESSSATTSTTTTLSDALQASEAADHLDLQKSMAYMDGQMMNPNVFPPMDPSFNGMNPQPCFPDMSMMAMSADGEKKHKMKREWRNIGWFTSDEEMNEVRKREKVSKRKSVAQINGTKVFYRCNNWRRTNCNFRMYAMYYAPNRISLNASGEHDHTTKNPHYVPRNYTGSMIYDISPCSSQQQVLNQFVMNATANSSYLFDAYDQENVFKTKTDENDCTPSLQFRPYAEPTVNPVKVEEEPVQQPPAPECIPYQLSDGQNIAELLQVAAEMGHKFSFNSRRTSEYCFESNAPEMRGRMVVFADHDAVVSVTERYNGIDRNCEEWRKADWKQFLWAVRGKCTNVLKGI